MINAKTKKGYLFIANSTKPTTEKANSLQPYTIGTFGYASIKAADELGYKLFCGINRNMAEQIKCTNFDIQFYNAHIYRNIFAFKDNWIAYKNLVKLLKEHPEIEVVHCNTPIGGVLGRICGYISKKIVIYTAHGFHFYKGAPLKNWLLYYPIEKILAKMTDALITMNQEDYEVAQKMNLNKGGKAYKINGVGVDLKAFDSVNVDVTEKRKILNLPKDAVVGIVVGDLNENKNAETIIRALALAKGNIHLLFCGVGPLEKSLKLLAHKKGLEDRCHFLGYRTDVKELYKISDMFEGLPRSTMEAMLAGLPCVVSNIRGNVDLIDNDKGGFLFPPKDHVSMAEAMTMMAGDPERRKRFGEYNKERIKEFDIEIAKQQMFDIYKEVFNL